MYYSAKAKQNNKEQAIRLLNLAKQHLNTAMLSITNYQAMKQLGKIE